MNEQLKIIISAEVAKLKQGVEDAKKKVKSFRDEVKQASENVDANFQKIGNATSTALKGLAVGTAAAITALTGVSAATAEYREAQSKLTTAFETAGSNAETAKETYNDLYRVLGDGDVAVEAANHLAKLTTEEKALQEWTDICQGVYATFGDSLPIEGLTEAANETAKVGTLTGSLADALNWAGVNEEKFQAQLDACNTEAEREALIRETLSGLYDEAAENYEKNSKQILEQNEAQAKLQESLAQIGEVMTPVLTAFTQFANEALAVVVPYVQELATNALPVLKEVLSGAAEVIGNIFGFIAENWPILLAMAGVITGIATAIGIYNTVAAIKAAMAAAEVTSVWGLVAAYAAQAAAMIVAIAPYVLIVAAIAAVIAIIVLCVKHWDKIKAKVKEVWDAIVKWIKEAVDKVVKKINDLVDKVKEKFESIKSAISEKIQAAKEKALSIFESIRSGIANKAQAAKDFVSNTFSAIKSAITDKIQAAKDKALSIFEGLKNGIKNKITSAKNAVKNVIDAIKGFFNFKFSWPKIPMPHFGISPQGWKVGDLLKGKIPKLSINWYAEGGVFDKPTLFSGNGVLSGLGENGAEAVVPLEKNTQWMSKLAAMLSERMGTGQPIILQVDGKTFAQTCVSSINNLTKQTGNLPFRLA